MDESNDDQSRQADDADIGARLKFIREHNGLSQRELAKRAGVPHSSISMIEQGLSSPSVNSLGKILNGIPMSLAHFFACDLSLLSQYIYRSDELKSNQQAISPGVSIQRIPIKNNELNFQFKRVSYSPTADTGAVPLISDKNLSGLVMQGIIELSVNAEVSSLDAGDAFSLSAFQPHRFRNTSTTQECVILVCET